MPPGEQGPVGGGALDGAPPPDAGAATAPARWRARASTAALALAIVLAYSNSWRAPFVFDDGFNIVRNPIVHDLSHFVHPWRVDGTVAPPALVYTLWSRYPAYLSFALDYALHGLDVRGYHVVNLAIHLAAALTVVALVRALLALPLFDRSRLRGREGATALLAGALFGLHPLQTQSVTYVVQRMTSLGGLFCLLAMLAYVRAVRDGARSAAGARGRRGRPAPRRDGDQAELRRVPPGDDRRGSGSVSRRMEAPAALAGAPGAGAGARARREPRAARGCGRSRAPLRGRKPRP
jgi:hypothetical protein